MSDNPRYYAAGRERLGYRAHVRSANKGMPILLLTALGTIELASRGWSWGRMTIW